MTIRVPIAAGEPQIEITESFREAFQPDGHEESVEAFVERFRRDARI